MQYAALLSDLNTLSICPPEAARTLVSAHKTVVSDQAGKGLTKAESVTHSDSDLQRADELVSLHYNVKLKYINNGLDSELLGARQIVQQVLRELNRQS